MDKIVTINNQTHLQTQSTIEEAVQEALYVAEFFGLVPLDPNTPPALLPADSPLVGYLESAETYADAPVGLDDLIVLAKFGGRRE
jgi:hypothetical protein